jgi:tryptophan 2,3-dioxygenase
MRSPERQGKPASDTIRRLEKRVELKTAVRDWRFRHVTMVERLIGVKNGTGCTPIPAGSHKYNAKTGG